MTAKLTGETITDEQLRELYSWGLSICRENEAPERYREYVRGSHAQYSASVALGGKRARRGDSRARARARCASLLNARTAKGQP